MTVIGNRFTPAFAGRRPDGPTPAPPGPDIRFATVTETAGRVNVTLQVGPGSPLVDAIDVDWGDGTRQSLGGLLAAHSYTDGGVFEIRAIATSNIGRESVNSIRLQVLEGAPPIPDPVADFTIAPAAPTTADTVTLNSISTPAEYIQINEWTQIMPAGGTQEGPPVMNLGLLQEGPYVWQLRVRLDDGRWSAPRSRGVSVTAAEDPEDPDLPPDPEAEP
jgi:hypothetical protein